MTSTSIKLGNQLLFPRTNICGNAPVSLQMTVAPLPHLRIFSVRFCLPPLSWQVAADGLCFRLPYLLPSLSFCHTGIRSLFASVLCILVSNDDIALGSADTSRTYSVLCSCFGKKIWRIRSALLSDEILPFRWRPHPFNGPPCSRPQIEEGPVVYRRQASRV